MDRITKKRVCMIVLNNFTRDIRVVKEARSLAENGYEVKVFAIHGKSLKENEEMHGFSVNRIKLKTLSWPRNRLLGIIKYIELLMRFFYWALRYKAAVYHCHDLRALPIGYVVTRFNRAKLVYDSHELWSDGSHKHFVPGIALWMERKLEHFLIKRVDTVITVSDSIAETIAKQDGIEVPKVIKNVPYFVKASKSSRIRKLIGMSTNFRPKCPGLHSPGR